MQTNNDDVTFTRPEVRALLPRWQEIEDCLAGEPTVKAKGTRYLPRPDASDTSTEATDRYNAYKTRAVFYNVARRTRDGLVGEVFNKPPEIDLNGKLSPLVDNIDGCGVTAEQQAKKMLARVLGFGRCGALADYPKVEGVTSLAQQQRGNIRPTITLYKPQDIINWRVSVVGGAKQLSLVVLQETHSVDGDFSTETQRQWRVLRLVDGLYVVEVWRETSAGGIEVVPDASSQPTDGRGAPMREIPFVFVGWQDSDPEPDSPPILDLVQLNLAHYRNSADYEESCFLVGQPTLVLSGLTSAWVKNELKGTVKFGSRSAVPLPQGATAALLQAAPNGMPFEAMEHKEKQMVTLGAQLVEDRSVQQTATEASFTRSTEMSVLASATSNVSEAYRRLLKWCADFASEMSEGVITLSDDITILSLDAQDQQTLIGLYQAGLISKPEARERLRQVGVVFQDDAKAEALIAADIGMGIETVEDDEDGE